MKYKGLALSVIVGLSFLYHGKYIGEFPKHIHAWAQSDRYALALGFIDNGFNFLAPQTFLYNHQFPDNWKSPSESTITSVDFPIHDYLVSLLMVAFGTTAPVVFRLYVLLFSFVGLFYLFKLSLLWTQNAYSSLFVVLFAATSPVYVYYQSSFLPSIPSLSCVLAGVYFYSTYLRQKQAKSLFLGVGLMTLATLSRTTFAIPLFAVLCVEFVRIFRKESSLRSLMPFVFSVLAIFSYRHHNQVVREKYGSAFLNELLPADSVSDFFEILSVVYERWFFEYFTAYHYAVLLAAFGAATLMLRSENFDKLQRPICYFGLWALTFFAGCVLFLVLMTKQFQNHDYYFIDTFYLAIVGLLIGALSLLHLNLLSFWSRFTLIVIGLLAIPMLVFPVITQEDRRATGPWDQLGKLVETFENSDEFLSSLSVSKSARILVLDAVVPNIPFIKMKRKGYIVIEMDKENIEAALTWDFDYLIFANENLEGSILKSFPAFLSKVHYVADNGKISVCTLRSMAKESSIKDFYTLTTRSPTHSFFEDFETGFSLESSKLLEVIRDSSWSNSGKFAGRIDGNLEYGSVYRQTDFTLNAMRPRKLVVSGHIKLEDDSEIELVCAVNSRKKSYFNSKEISATDSADPTDFSFFYQLPQLEQPSEFKFYIWNKDGTTIFVDDLKLAFY